MKEESKENSQTDENKDEGSNKQSLEYNDERINLQGSGIFVCTLTLIGTRLGGGIVELPYVIFSLGPTVGLWMQILYAVISFI